MTAPASVEVEELRVVRGDRVAVEAGALEVLPGEVLALVGPNGAGKSSLLSAMALLLRPAAGQVLHRGARVDHLRGRALLEARRRLGCVFQEPLLLDRSVGWNVELGLGLRGAPAAERRRAAGRAMALLGIEGLADRRASALSGGEARRAAIARALAVSPDVLFLDEPFSSLDEPTRRALVSDASELLRGDGRSTVLVTHDRREALALADRAALLLGGRLVQVGQVAGVMGRPATEEAAVFLGFDNLFAGELVETSADGRVRVRLGGGVEVEATGLGPGAPPRSVVLRARPEDLALAAPGSSAALDSPGIAGAVARVVPEGFACRLTVEAEPAVVVVAAAKGLEAAGLGRGSPVTVALPPPEALLAYW